MGETVAPVDPSQASDRVSPGEYSFAAAADSSVHRQRHGEQVAPWLSLVADAARVESLLHITGSDASLARLGRHAAPRSSTSPGSATLRRIGNESPPA